MRACQRSIEADVVAFDQPFMFNRMGAGEPGGMIYALRSDVVPIHGTGLTPGNVQLRSGKRPRPITLRANVGDCLRISFTNLLSTVNFPPSSVTWPGAGSAGSGQDVSTLEAGISVAGLDLVQTAADGGIVVGVDAAGATVSPGQRRVYTLLAAREGTNLLTSSSATFNSSQQWIGGQLTSGLFGAVNVQPAGASWYRSQITAAELALASNGKIQGTEYPNINYEAVFPANYVRPDGTRPVPNTPILNMLRCDTQAVPHCTLFHTDLTAIITGPNHGLLPEPTGSCGAGDKLCVNPAVPDRRKPYREFTIIYHEDVTAVQAFPAFNSGLASNVLTAGGDNFAINYGTGGISAEIVANRNSMGPAKDCSECKFEEFFLSSWAGGDPAVLVNVPVNAPAPRQNVKSLYPDDPSNVYHSYINDRVTFRVLHGGSNVHHVHHLHAHQWLFSAADDKSAYLDSQAIGPGSQYTMEIAHGGTGNRNRTPGDSIFHCHFYPHFASGMWALWRSHDVFESGTQLDADGITPALRARALPDGEIDRGTPIPAIVPMPTLAMPPIPGAAQIDPNNPRRVLTPGVNPLTGQGDNPGYPFYIPGVAGHRPPHPPLDFAQVNGVPLDGGLPRHVVVSGTAKATTTGQSFAKTNLTMLAERLPEQGTPAEAAAMRFHAAASHATRTPAGQTAEFKTNGKNPTSGAPFADPCGDWGQQPTNGATRTYKAADMQFDAIFNKSGWHYPQQRILSLWEDVKSYNDRTRPPEPLFFRANSNDCVTYWHTNLVPGSYEKDDFQVTTPTDVIGQHIHLVKFDVTSSDGAENGWNYEDGTFSPDEVRERIKAMTRGCGAQPNCGLKLGQTCLRVNPVTNICESYSPPSSTIDRSLRPTGVGPATPYAGVFGSAPNGQHWEGAQTTVQRWWADNVLDCQGNDRTLRTVFTHDHFGPSTHQQAGLYAGLVVEPTGSTWSENVLANGRPVPMYTRSDGGPTSWQAVITTQNAADSYREFLLEFQDTTLTYDRANKSVGTPRTSPQLISNSMPGTTSVNYRNEPIPYRVNPPTTGTPASCPAGTPNTDLGFAFSSICRQDPALNTQPTQRPGVSGNDPITPVLQAYQGDRVQVRTLVGAHQSLHNFSIHGMKWRFEPSAPNSGYRNSQAMGISEHFEMLFDVPPSTPSSGTVRATDYVYSPSGYDEALANGSWGIFRAWEPNQTTPQLPVLPNAARGQAGDRAFKVCDTPNRRYNVTAVTAGQIQELGAKGLTYYDRTTPETFRLTITKGGPLGTMQFTLNWATGGYPPIAVTSSTANGQPWSYLVPRTVTTLTFNPITYEAGKSYVINSDNSITPTTGDITATNAGLAVADPNAILYFHDEDLQTLSTTPISTFKLANSRHPVEPLVLRAAAGDCIEVTLSNKVNPNASVFTTHVDSPGAIGNSAPITPSTQVGLHPQLVSFDATTSNGINAGINAPTTAAPGASITYRWYAGSVSMRPNIQRTPVEFGAINLLPADPLEQHPHGAFGALIVEPAGSTWQADAGFQRTSVTVFPPGGQPFRELVTVVQSDTAVSTGLSVNYTVEPLSYRYGQMGPQPSLPADLSCTLSNRMALYWSPNAQSYQSAPPVGNPHTPVFAAGAGMPVRFRMLHAGVVGGSFTVTTLSGHSWQEEPYKNDSTTLGCSPLTAWTGSRMGGGSTEHFDMLIPKAGGEFGVHGDYLWRDFNAWDFFSGTWGIFRVTEPNKDAVTITYNSGSKVIGTNTVVMNLRAGTPARYAPRVTLYQIGANGMCDTTKPITPNTDERCKIDVDPATGTWSWPGSGCRGGAAPSELCAVSDGGGVGYWRPNTDLVCEKATVSRTPPKMSTKAMRQVFGRLGLSDSVLRNVADDAASTPKPKPKQ